MLQQEKLEEVFDRPFKDDGENFVGLCPVHNESTPSFHVHKKYLLVNCFGCGAKGGLVAFVRKYKSVESSDAAKMLGIEFQDQIIPLFKFEEPKKKEVQVYPESWLAPFEKGVHKYVLSRGFTQETIERAGGLYDRTLKRQVFPHRRRDGQLVGAIGRSCRGGHPKWYYYWHYQKGSHLYRQDLAGGYEASRSLSPTWIVEGVFDVLWLNQHGIDAEAILGSKPSDEQIQEIRTHHDRVVLALDNDEAGLTGTRILYEKLGRHMEVLLPIWPRQNIDVMDINPHELSLLNPVEEAIHLGRENRSIL